MIKSRWGRLVAWLGLVATLAAISGRQQSTVSHLHKTQNGLCRVVVSVHAVDTDRVHTERHAIHQTEKFLADADVAKSKDPGTRALVRAIRRNLPANKARLQLAIEDERAARVPPSCPKSKVEK